MSCLPKTLGLALLALFLAGCGSLPKRPVYHDPIEQFATEGAACARAVEYALTTAGGQFFRAQGPSMHPFRYVGVTVADFAHTKIGDRVTFTDARGIGICHRVESLEKNGTLRVTGDVYPWRTDYVTPKNYLGTVVLMCAWSE